MRRLTQVCLILVLATLSGASVVFAQGVTTATLGGTVRSSIGEPISGATVRAVHEPSGSAYGGITRSDGRFLIPGMRVGGPYRVTVSNLGYRSAEQADVTLNLGVTTNIALTLVESAIALEGVTVTGTQAAAILSPDRTGAATSVTRETIEVLPTISGRIESVTRLTPQYGGGSSFGGVDNRLNNITVDGSYFNNSFGLGGQPGDRTGVAPISLKAIEQVQVNIAPFDVRQGNFVGAGINSVTRSGGNEFRGELYYDFRDQGMMGDRTRDTDVSFGTFDYRQLGGWLSGPIIQNKLFFFVNYEDDALNEPGTTWLANPGGALVDGNITRVEQSDLQNLSNFLRTNFDYETGPWQGYNSETPATRFLTKLDYNVNERNKLSLRYNHLDSFTDVLASNSSSLGFGSRRSSSQALNFQNTNYQILENIRSLVGEWNSMIGDNMANNLILGYSSHDESRASRGDFFPLVDVLQGGSTYTSFGFEPFTPSNELRYNTLQFQNNFTRFGERHTLTFGVSAERYESENVFFPGSQSAYVYNSLADFYTDANNFLANSNRTTSPVSLRRFQLRWSNIPGMDRPVQPLEVFYGGLYAQDEWQVTDDLRLTIGARMDVPVFGATGFANANADALTFRDEDGNPVQYSTASLPDANPLFSPRVGFNWDVLGDRTTQVRGGTGIFTGRPAFVWISNQIGNTGVLTGFEQLDNTTARPFHPDPNHYKPSSVTGAPAGSYELALTDQDFRFPQVWRNNLAVDQQLPFGIIGTGEFLYSRDLNGVYYINANLPAAQSAFTGADTRPRWVGPSCGGSNPVSPCVNRLNNQLGNQVSNAIVLKNQNEGYSWNLSGSLERPFANGLFAKAGYSFGEAKNTVDPGSIAFGSWNNNQHSGDPNNPGLGFSNFSPGNRLFGAATYRAEWLRFGATTITLFGDRFTAGNASYTFSGDANGDGGTFNDLIYIPANISEMNFQAYTAGSGASARTYTAQQQAEAWEAYILQDPYLSKNRGRYAERNALFLPMVFRADLSLAQEVFTDIRGRRNGLQLRADVLNVGNLINSDWGAGYRVTSTSPLTNPSADSQGRLQYRMREINNQLMTETFGRTTGIGDVYRVQLGLRYMFN
ncbi:carboxypeptidase regulatory-like domain-containing protein [soil metagenome]